MLNVDWLIDFYFFNCFNKSGLSNLQSLKQTSVSSTSLIIIFNNTQTKSKYLKSEEFDNVTLRYFLIKISIIYYFLLT